MKSSNAILAKHLDSVTDGLIDFVDAELETVGRETSEAQGIPKGDPSDRPVEYVVHDFPAEVRR